MNSTYDKKAVKILVSTYWTSGAWNVGKRRIAPDDFAYGLEKGVLHHPISLTHDELISKLQDVLRDIEPACVGRAFTYSLSSRDLAYRSALGSYAALRWLPEHSSKGKKPCRICGEYLPINKEDLNVLNFERLKWGGVRHDQPLYGWFDLSEFLKLPDRPPTEQDQKILGEILHRAASLPANAWISELEKSLVGLFPSSKTERSTLLEILSFAGILAPTDRPGFFQEHTAFSDREERAVHTIDWDYPAQWWQGKHGLNWEAVRFYFPDLQPSYTNLLFA